MTAGCGYWNPASHPAFADRMDDKSLNLWRQIEGGRRSRRQPLRRARPATPVSLPR
ncbi:MAG TPA: hypothetical protein VF079_06835 [Sphingomicrobium sp.]